MEFAGIGVLPELTKVKRNSDVVPIGVRIGKNAAVESAGSANWACAETPDSAPASTTRLEARYLRTAKPTWAINRVISMVALFFMFWPALIAAPR